MKKILFFTLCLMSLGLFAKTAPEFTLKDIDGKEHKLSDYKGKLVVLEYVNYNCPFIKKHYDNSGNIPKLQETYKSKGVIWLSICSSAEGKQGYYSPEKVKEIQSDNGAKPTAYLIDEDGQVGKSFRARVTPHVFIIDTKGEIAYDGAIDSIKSTKAADIKKATPYVKNALDALLANKPVPVKESKPYGCGVKY